MRTVLLGALAVLAPIQPLLVTVGVLIAADTVTGIMAAHKRGERIKSSGLGRAIVKLFVYQTVLITGFLMEQYLLQDTGIPIIKLLAGIIGLTEFLSLLENTETITGVDLLKLKKLLGSKNDRD